jgi:hypothetical protein
MMLSLASSENAFTGNQVITQESKEFIHLGLIMIAFTVLTAFVMGGYFYLLNIESKIESEWAATEERMLRIDDDNEERDCYEEKMRFLNS